MYRLMVAALAAFAAGVASAAAQNYPSQAVHLVVPFPPGGGTDALARAIQDPLQKAFGQRSSSTTVAAAAAASATRSSPRPRPTATRC